MDLQTSRTAANLRAAFAREAANNRRYLYFARRADAEGWSDIAAMFRDVAEGETVHALGLLEFLEVLGDPTSGHPIGDTVLNLESALLTEAREASELYPRYASQAREEGLEEIAGWFDLVANAESRHLRALQDALDTLQEQG